MAKDVGTEESKEGEEGMLTRNEEREEIIGGSGRNINLESITRSQTRIKYVSQGSGREGMEEE